mmetsp:Transcript_15532/g.36648  ORF Transcript_15532/g.36648 Transcript_15532/m.36648 type:complete len:216 (-) Transcript_15532:2585-3232(-)
MHSRSKCPRKPPISLRTAAPRATSASARSFSARSSSIRLKLSSSTPSGQSSNLMSSSTWSCFSFGSTPRSGYGSAAASSRRLKPGTPLLGIPTVEALLRIRPPSSFSEANDFARFSGSFFLRNSWRRAVMAFASRVEFAKACLKYWAEETSFSDRTRSSCSPFAFWTSAENALNRASHACTVCCAAAKSNWACSRTRLSSTFCNSASCKRAQYSS